MTFRWGRLGVAAVVLQGVALAAQAAISAGSSQGPVLITSDFENGTLNGWGASGNAPTVQAEVKLGGRYAMRSYLNRNASKTSYRTEASVGQENSAAMGEEYWYGFSVYLPTSHVPDTTAWELVAQWHRVPDDGTSEVKDPGNPPLALQTTGNVWKLVNLWDDARVASSPRNRGPNAGEDSWELGAITANDGLGSWTDWVVNVRWSPGGDGFLKVWKNGVQVVDKKGPNCYADSSGPYFKMGIYKGWRSGDKYDPRIIERTVYHDEFRMAGRDGSYEAVAPRLARVQPNPPLQVSIE